MRNLLDKLAAAEGYDCILVGAGPSLGVAVDEGDVSRVAHGVNATFQEALVFVLAIDDTGGSVFPDEGDGKEFSFGFCDQVVEFDLHGWSHWLCLFGLFV